MAAKWEVRSRVAAHAAQPCVCWGIFMMAPICTTALYPANDGY
jgi:hypothetical protein